MACVSEIQKGGGAFESKVLPRWRSVPLEKFTFSSVEFGVLGVEGRLC